MAFRLVVYVDSGHALQIAGEWEFGLQLEAPVFGRGLLLVGELHFLLIATFNPWAKGRPPRDLRLEGIRGEGGTTEPQFGGKDLKGYFGRVSSGLPLTLQILSNTMRVNA